MKTMKYFLLLAICSFSLGIYSQNVIKGIAVDAQNNPLASAKIKTDKSKAVSYTNDKGVYEINVQSKDKFIFLCINDHPIIAKPLTEAVNIINFKVSDQRPLKGFLEKDGITYFIGQQDKTFEDIASSMGAYLYQDGLMYYVNSRKIFKTYIIDGFRRESMNNVAPSSLYSIKIIRANSHETFKYDMPTGEGLMILTTIEGSMWEQENKSKLLEYKNDDTLRGVVKDTWGRPVGGLKLKTPSGESSITDTNGIYALKLNKKDKYLRATVDYTQGMNVRIKRENHHAPLNFSVMLDKNTMRGFLSKDGLTYYIGEGDLSWETIVNQYFTGVKFLPESGMIWVKWQPLPIDYYQLDGAPIENLNMIPDIHRIYSITIIKDGTSNIYGYAGQYGSVILKSVDAVRMTPPVPLTDWNEVKAKKVSGEQGMRMLIENQGKGIFYDHGKVIIDDKICQMYIVNGMSVENIAGLESIMIDEIIIIRTGAVPVYGDKAQNGVVLITATKKERTMIDEHGETVKYKKTTK